jgi:hypothetical protein
MRLILFGGEEEKGLWGRGIVLKMTRRIVL